PPEQPLSLPRKEQKAQPLPPAGVPTSHGNGPAHYSSERKLEIPYTLCTQRPFRQLHLHVSTDCGLSYSRVGSASKPEGHFEYTAKADGWYFFIAQVEEPDGTTSPRDLNLSSPRVRFCVDTEKPIVQMRPVLPQGEGRVAVEWSIADKNAD